MVYEIINLYYSDLTKEKHQRYKSWEHCYTFFKKHKNIDSEEKKTMLCYI